MEPFHLTKDLTLIETAAFLPGSRTLIVSDLQIGMEGQLRAAGQTVPAAQGSHLFGLLSRLLTATGATRLVIDGDLKHEFGRISAQERSDVLALLRAMRATVEVVLVRGNHDTLTGPLATEVGLSLVDSWSEEGVYVVHGHRAPDAADPAFVASHTIIIGHMHPAVRLSDGVRSERYKCFLAAWFAGKLLLVLPSLSAVTEGSDVLTTPPNTPLLPPAELPYAKIYVVADAIRYFGTVGRLREKMGGS